MKEIPRKKTTKKQRKYIFIQKSKDSNWVLRSSKNRCGANLRKKN